MTRAERITEYLTEYVDPSVFDHPDFSVDSILAIADDRTLLSLADFAQAIGRDRTTIRSWMARGNVKAPHPSYRCGAGPLWDEEAVEAFKIANPGEVTTEGT